MCTALYVHKCPRLIVPKEQIKSCIIGSFETKKWVTTTQTILFAISEKNPNKMCEHSDNDFRTLLWLRILSAKKS